jgi:hypothetical protein
MAGGGGGSSALFCMLMGLIDWRAGARSAFRTYLYIITEREELGSDASVQYLNNASHGQSLSSTTRSR